jgi:hypothetical protein
MRASHIQDCQMDLNFKPIGPWPKALPLYSWQGQLLCGFDQACQESSEKPMVIELSAPFPEVLKCIYPRLSFPELARLESRLRTWNPDLTLPVFQAYGVRFEEKLNEPMNFLVSLPLSVQNWLSEKDVGARDIERLLPLSNDSELASHEALQFCIENRFNKNQTLQSCEWIGELLALGFSKEMIFRPEVSPDAFLMSLKTLRHPNSTDSDLRKKVQIQALSWPSKTDAKWVRQGDLAGLEIKLHAHTEQEAEKQIMTLVKLKGQIAELWKAPAT